jgi:hypothetical protein
MKQHLILYLNRLKLNKILKNPVRLSALRKQLGCQTLLPRAASQPIFSLKQRKIKKQNQEKKGKLMMKIRFMNQNLRKISSDT